jgi:exodeoxyribonuclease V gamma subunit
MAGDASIRVYRSNRAEVLTEVLAEVVGKPLVDPLAAEWIVVQGRGMATWLAGQLAEKLGVWANAKMLYPRNFVQRVIALGLGSQPSAAYGEESLPWVILSCLDDLLETPAFAPLARYVESDGDGMRRWQLVSAIARCFDEYLSYRPEDLLRWESGGSLEPDEQWQALLWRSIRDQRGPEHVAARASAFVERMATESPDVFPQRVCIFGLSSMPPIYVRVIVALCRHTEVHLFSLSPCQEYWADSVSPEQALRSIERGAAEEELHLDVAHPLLASLGGQGAAFQRLLDRELEAASCALIERPDTLYRPPEGDSVLARLQRRILGGAAPLEAMPRAARALDTSIAIHSCHSPTREVEVLRDQLLAILTDGSDFRPEDVVVMMPDIEAYAPLIEAVFSADRADPRFIPFHIADRSLRSDAPVLEALDRLLMLVGGRVAQSEVVDLLRLDVVHRRFGIEAHEIETAARWLAESGVRWGIDGEHRREHGFSGDEQNTWQFGLDRLLLGYAMPTDEQGTFGGVLPYDEIEGGASELLGRLAAFCDALFAMFRSCRSSRGIDDWHHVLSQLLAQFFVSDDDTAWQHERVLGALSQLREWVNGANFSGELSLPVVRAWLSDRLESGAGERGFVAGGVTFCAMVPMRSIPFDVMCLLGMNDGAFPRQTRRVDFDRMRLSGLRDGDRSRRDDDRYLFLESVLSARRRLLISYCGQSIKDDRTRPPSVVLSELLDQLRADHEEGTSEPFDLPRGVREEDEALAHVLPRVLTRHPLQPFSPRYFDGSDERLFSYVAYPSSDEAVAVTPSTLFTQPLGLPENASDDIDIDELIDFYGDPILYLLRRRLGVAFHRAEDQARDGLPLLLSSLESYQVGDRLLSWGDAKDGAEQQSLLRATGMMPPGGLGALVTQDLQVRSTAIHSVAKALRGDRTVQSVAVRVELPDGPAIHGVVPNVYGDRVVGQQFSTVRARHVLGAWIRHLALTAAAPHRVAHGSAIVGQKDKAYVSYRFPGPAPEAVERLQELVAHYQIGQREPLLLCPSAAFAYARALAGKPDEAAALSSARAALVRDWRHQGSIAALFPGIDLLANEEHPLGEAFQGPRFGALAKQVFSPLCEQVEIS